MPIEIDVRERDNLEGCGYQELMQHSAFINGLKKNGIDLNRKVLADMAMNDSNAFASLIGTLK